MEMRATREVLLKRHGLVFFDDLSTGPELEERYVKAVELELAQLGYAASARLTARLARLPIPALASLSAWLQQTLAAMLGGGHKHEPLFRAFPDKIPRDTYDLWVRKILVHFAQADGQPCLFCGREGTTHVLEPCRHVVCDQCFDGANYSRCPSCERQVDQSSPFFKPAKKREAAQERVRFKRLDLAPSLDAAARELLVGFCARAQAMSPDDVAALTAVVSDFRERALPWLPEVIPVRENVAHVFGTLFRAIDPERVLPIAATYLKTATDVLRLVAVFSGADAALVGAPVIGKVEDALKQPPESPWQRQLAKVFRGTGPKGIHMKMPLAIKVKRFKVAKLRRPLRRALLALLEGMNPDSLTEDMLRHRSYWVWLGEHLHPHEYASRFPQVARAFQIVRGKAPDGTPAPEFGTWRSRAESALATGDADQIARLLGQRPGELARRYDHALRAVGNDPIAAGKIMAAFAQHAHAFSTPVLLTLRNVLPTRLAPAPLRVYWPKTAAALGVTGEDTRPPLRADVVGAARRQIDEELLRRFGLLPAFEDAILDEQLRSIIVPFNERTASRSAVALPRGSRVPLDGSKRARLFLHWCQPPDGESTDIDLSVAFYDAAWRYIGVCSYYQLVYPGTTGELAISSGDVRDAPPPDGGTEFVDVDRAVARAEGIRYCVMVVNNYSGMQFSQLERAFAGLMLRDSKDGLHFDPRTVALRFDVQGENGVFMPFAIDLETEELHWLDVQAKGQLEMNNVASSNNAIATVCPNLIRYFGSGIRPTMFELAALHAAARARRVHLRTADGGVRSIVRKTDEAAPAFLARVLGEGGAAGGAPTSGAPAAGALPPPDRPVFAALYRDDIELAEGSTTYALFRERAGATIAAASLISPAK